MPTRREVLLDAAIEVLASGGARALTHRAVDANAGLPTGSTSNLFRTRAALVGGVVGRIGDLERVQLHKVLGASAPVDEQLLVQIAAAAITNALGPGRSGTLARRSLFHEAAHDPATGEQLWLASRAWWSLTADLLTAAGVEDAAQPARWLLAYLDGLIGDQLARPDPAFDPARAIRPAVRGILAT